MICVPPHMISSRPIVRLTSEPLLWRSGALLFQKELWPTLLPSPENQVAFQHALTQWSGQTNARCLCWSLKCLTVVHPETCSHWTPLLGPLWPNFSVDFSFIFQFPILSWTPRVTRHRCKHWFLINLAFIAFSDLQLRHDSGKHFC